MIGTVFTIIMFGFFGLVMAYVLSEGLWPVVREIAPRMADRWVSILALIGGILAAGLLVWAVYFGQGGSSGPCNYGVPPMYRDC